MEGNKRDVFNFIVQRLKATQRERLTIYKFFQNIDSELKPKKNLEKVPFDNIWRLYKLIEISPRIAERLLMNVKDARWFHREVIRGLRGVVMPSLPSLSALGEATKKKKKKKKTQRVDSPLPTVISQGGGIIVPLTATVNTGAVPSLGMAEGEEEMTVVEALDILSQVNR